MVAVRGRLLIAVLHAMTHTKHNKYHFSLVTKAKCIA